MKTLKHLPNFITLLNLLSGSLSILFFAEGEILLAAWMIFIAAALDFLDGFAARALKAYSKIGAQLDSLADVVSFGLAPAFLIYHLILNSHGRMSVEIAGLDILPYVALLIPLFSALRLAKFQCRRQTNRQFPRLANAGLCLVNCLTSIAERSVVRRAVLVLYGGHKHLLLSWHRVGAVLLMVSDCRFCLSSSRSF